MILPNGATTAAMSHSCDAHGAALRRFRLLAEELLTAARSGDAEAMGVILAERRALLGTLGGDDPGGNPARIRALREILDLDRESEAILERRRSEVRHELAALGHGRRHARACSRIDVRG